MSDAQSSAAGGMKAPLLLVRHTAVDVALKGRCYGGSDVALSPEGEAAIPNVVADVTAQLSRAGFASGAPVQIVHSGLSRAMVLAEALATHLNAPLRQDRRLREMDFGRWELMTWDAIFAEVGHDMIKMVSEPETFAPHGGETVAALSARAKAWLIEVDRSVTTVAVCHGGVISAIRGQLDGRPAKDWPGLVPPYGGVVSLD